MKKQKIKLAALVMVQVNGDGSRKEVMRMTPKQIKNLVMYQNQSRLLCMSRQGAEGGFFELHAEIGGGI